MCARGNEWINDFKEASDNDLAKAKAKAKAKHESRPREGPAEAEPKCATVEEAGAAAQACANCLPCADGSKGCRACAGNGSMSSAREVSWPERATDLSCAGKL
eukprot:9243437-Pyramimonas_sp.AAC.1